MRVCVYVVLDIDVKVHPREGVVAVCQVWRLSGADKKPKKKEENEEERSDLFFKSKPLSSSSSSSEVARAYIKSTRHTT
jgi:hypothetical protein